MQGFACCHFTPAPWSLFFPSNSRCTPHSPFCTRPFLSLVECQHTIEQPLPPTFAQLSAVSVVGLWEGDCAVLCAAISQAGAITTAPRTAGLQHWPPPQQAVSQWQRPVDQTQQQHLQPKPSPWPTPPARQPPPAPSDHFRPPHTEPLPPTCSTTTPAVPSIPAPPSASVTLAGPRALAASVVGSPRGAVPAQSPESSPALTARTARHRSGVSDDGQSSSDSEDEATGVSDATRLGRGDGDGDGDAIARGESGIARTGDGGGNVKSGLRSRGGDRGIGGDASGDLACAIDHGVCSASATVQAHSMSSGPLDDPLLGVPFGALSLCDAHARAALLARPDRLASGDASLTSHSGCDPPASPGRAVPVSSTFPMPRRRAPPPPSPVAKAAPSPETTSPVARSTCAAVHGEGRCARDVGGGEAAAEVCRHGHTPRYQQHKTRRRSDSSASSDGSSGAPESEAPISTASPQSFSLPLSAPPLACHAAPALPYFRDLSAPTTGTPPSATLAAASSFAAAAATVVLPCSAFLPRAPPPPPDPHGGALHFIFSGRNYDGQGVLYYLGTAGGSRTWRNPLAPASAGPAEDVANGGMDGGFVDGSATSNGGDSRGSTGGRGSGCVGSGDVDLNHDDGTGDGEDGGARADGEEGQKDAERNADEGNDGDPLAEVRQTEVRGWTGVVARASSVALGSLEQLAVPGAGWSALLDMRAHAGAELYSHCAVILSAVCWPPPSIFRLTSAGLHRNSGLSSVR